VALPHFFEKIFIPYDRKLKCIKWHDLQCHDIHTKVNENLLPMLGSKVTGREGEGRCTDIRIYDKI
jgi:hypothetical protein